MPSDEHIYASWDSLEFDKGVAAWLIVRFRDPQAKFVFYPSGTDIDQGRLFDVPGAEWSRKHRQCTSDCIWESLSIQDPSAEQIVMMAHNIEINYWQLSQFPSAGKAYEDIRTIIEQSADPMEYIVKSRSYFDILYSSLQTNDSNNK